MKSLLAWTKKVFWKYVIATAFNLLGREVTIEGRPGKVKVFPIVWKGRLPFVGLNGDVNFTAIEFINDNTVRFIDAAQVSTEGTSAKLTKPAGNRIAHVILGHLPKEQIEALLNHASRLATVHFTNRPPPDWVFIGDYDAIPLQPKYLEKSVTLARREQAGFVGQSIRDVTSSNCTFVTPAAAERKLGLCAENDADRHIRIYHTIGAAFLISWDCLVDMREQLNRFPGVYFELAMPTSAVLAGYRIISMQACGHEWDHIRYRPHYAITELASLQAEGVPLAHPVKEIDGFLAIAASHSPLKSSPGVTVEGGN